MTDTQPRERSPRAPIITLSKALDRAQDFYDANKRHAVRVETAYTAWGYKPKSSGARQTLATLIMYGILQDSGSGMDRKVQLTDTAWRYLIDERPEPKAEALRSLALAPRIMQELWTSWGDDPPSPAECISQLHIDRGFTEDTARDVLAIYKDNIAFAALRRDDRMQANEETDDDDAGQRYAPPRNAWLNQAVEVRQELPSPAPVSGRQVSIMSGERELVTGLLSKEVSFRVIVNGNVGVKEIDRLIRKLELDKEILADAEEDEELKDLLG